MHQLISRGLLAGLFLVGCSGQVSAVEGTTIGPHGGTVAANGASVDIPPGALTENIAIRVSVATTGAPALPQGAVGQAFAFEPHTQAFAKEITITLPYSGAATSVAVFSAEPGDKTWTVLPGASRVGNTVRVQSMHFSYDVTVDSSAGDMDAGAMDAGAMDAGAMDAGMSGACPMATMPPCAPGLVLCGGIGCVDVVHDQCNCGACGAACPAGKSCSAGVCG